MRIRTWIIWILLAYAIVDYGAHEYSSGYGEGYNDGWIEGEAQEPKVWQTRLK